MTHPSVKTCECGHLQVEHGKSDGGFPHPVRYGICLQYGCPCLTFVEQVVTEKAA